jgi:hypothetical protein
VKFLVIDSHKGKQFTSPQNLHWLNANKLKQYLISLGHDVDLIWSYPTVNDHITVGYDCIIFNHASRYAYISDEWLRQNSNARMFYITNEYNLGEPLVLWTWAKEQGTQFEVIANHPQESSKVVKRYVSKWNILNLNALIVEETPYTSTNNFFQIQKQHCVYYGSFRRDRGKYFQKYLTGNIVVSTHMKNREKFREINVSGPFRDRIDWTSHDLLHYKTLLYIEDEKTHRHYNFLANRFYEGLNYNVFPLFDKSCMNTIEQSGYIIPDYALVDNVDAVKYITQYLPETATHYLETWRTQAIQEKQTVLQNITQLITS